MGKRMKPQILGINKASQGINSPLRKELNAFTSLGHHLIIFDLRLATQILYAPSVSNVTF